MNDKADDLDHPQPEDPFAQAAGRVGSAAPPSWGQAAVPGADRDRPRPSKHHNAKLQPGGVYGQASYGTSKRSYRTSSSYGSSRRYRQYRYGRYRRTLAPNQQNWLFLFLGIPTLGLCWLFGLLVSWRGYKRSRQGVTAPPVRWLRWAVTFTVLSAAAIPFWVAVGISAHNNHNNDSSVNLPPPVSLTRSLGQSATLTDLVAPNNSEAEVPVTMTVSDFAYPTRLGNQVDGRPDTATARLAVCATTKAVDPMVVVFSLAAQADGDLVNADFDTAFQTTPLRNTLQPGRCATGLVGFPVAPNQTIQAVQFSMGGGGVAWSVPAGTDTGGPSTT